MIRRSFALAALLGSGFFSVAPTVRAAPPPKNGAAAPPKKGDSPAAPNKEAAAPDKSSAVPAATKAEAAARFDRGLQLFNEGDNAGALAEFKQTYALMPNPVVLFNIGLVYAAMGRPVEAVDALTPVVAAGGLSPAQRDHAQKTLSDQQARIGRLSITTVPDGARIELDNVEVARTPLAAPLRVSEGSHVIGAVAEGYANARKEVVVAGNADAAVHFELVLSQSKRPANLTVHSRISDADILIDGKSQGKTPLASSVSLPGGHHVIELRRPGYKPSKQELDLGEGATGDVTLDTSMDSAASSQDVSTLSLDLRGQQAEVFVDQEHLGPYSSPILLPRGPHRLRLEVAGFLPAEQAVNVEPGKTNQIRPHLEPTAETRAAHDDNVRFHRVWGWVGVGAGALIAGGGVAWLAANAPNKSKAQTALDAAQAQFDSKMPPNCDLTGMYATNGMGNTSDQCNGFVDSKQSALDSAKSKDIIGFVGIGVGAAAFVTGVVILLTGESSSRFDSASAEPGPKPWRLSWAPGPGQLGAGLQGAF